MVLLHCGNEKRMYKQNLILWLDICRKSKYSDMKGRDRSIIMLLSLLYEIELNRRANAVPAMKRLQKRRQPHHK